MSNEWRHASTHRSTDHEIGQIHQGPNSFGLVMTRRLDKGGALGNRVQVEVKEAPALILEDGSVQEDPARTLPEHLTQAELVIIHSAFEILERKGDIIQAKWVAAPERALETIEEAKRTERAAREAVKAAEDQAAAVEAEHIVKREALKADVEQLEAKLARGQAVLARLEEDKARSIQAAEAEASELIRQVHERTLRTIEVAEVKRAEAAAAIKEAEAAMKSRREPRA